MENPTTRPKASFLLLFSAASVSLAGPVTTVPWNGHAGAVSFTFDDACSSQLTNAVPALKARKINATFFLYNSGNAFSNNKAAWVAAAKDGNELANHTLDHSDLSKATNAATEVTSMAALLRGADPSIQAVTLAYPGCLVGNESAVGAENFLARSCLFSAPYTPLQWKNQPSDWLNVAAIYVSDDATATGPTITAIDAAKNGGWISTLVHGVGGDWLTISTANVTAMFDRAIKDSLWVGTYQQVGAYWRAHFTMDAVGLPTGASPWALEWGSPHPKMPKSVMLKVKIDAAAFGSPITVSQNSVVIPANADGSYTIDFMKLKLTVTKGTMGIDDRTIYGIAQASVAGSSLVFKGLTPGGYTLSLRTVSGHLMQRLPLAASTSEIRVPLPGSTSGRRILAILEAPGMETRTFPVLVP
jgi:peptidoglycan/xylan/chitin deacetylase (PgdA/CDA1 family)